MKQQDNEQSQPPVAQFSTGLRCLTFWCPCITFGQIAEIVDKGSAPCGVSGTLYTLLLGFTGFQWIYSCMYRSKLKALYGIEDDCCEDCCTHFWCECCALCQEYRELQHRGYDVALGTYFLDLLGSRLKIYDLTVIRLSMFELSLEYVSMNFRLSSQLLYSKRRTWKIFTFGSNLK
ncbi:hypothetical protein Cgig2_022401 [Carnegiea gigantea]|uniref:Uncharacterized protein n=1 Tax=Carnegiea gigantea TaxID=171969 RepID=A0A9Q1KGP4_9CARY|nr:hypothetical protein Cgig2_022401 [Carnegiea gigantea]